MAIFPKNRRTGKNTETKTLYLDLPTGRISVTVIRSSRKSLALQMTSDGNVTARIPTWVSDAELKKFLNEHKQWIIQKRNGIQRARNNQQSIGAPPLQNLSASQRRIIRERIMDRVTYYSRRMGVSVGRVTIRSQKTRWGSCSSKGNVNFNYLLAYLPQELLDYVVIHELSHRKQMNHSAAFWAEVEKYCPDYKNCRKKLKGYRLG